MSLAVVLLCFSLFLLQSRFVSSLLPNIMLKSLTEPGSLIFSYVSLYLDSLFYSRLPFLPSLYLEFPNIQRSSSYSAPSLPILVRYLHAPPIPHVRYRSAPHYLAHSPHCFLDVVYLTCVYLVKHLFFLLSFRMRPHIQSSLLIIP